MGRKIPTEDLREELIRLSNELGETPTKKDMRRDGEYSGWTYANKFGSWSQALRDCGIEPTYEIPIPEDTLIKDLQDFGDEVEGTPGSSEMRRDGPHSPATYRKRFGCWEGALRAAGYEDIPRWGKIETEELIEEIHRMVDDEGTPPSYQEMDEVGEYSTSVYENRFGAWGDAIIEAGYEPRTPSDYLPRGEDHPHWVEGVDSVYYGPNWGRQRKKALKRDGYRCTIPTCTVTDEGSKDQFGVGLHVHHLRRLEDFMEEGSINYESANDLSNLLTLCPSHHNRYEGVPIDVRHITDAEPSAAD